MNRTRLVVLAVTLGMLTLVTGCTKSKTSVVSGETEEDLESKWEHHTQGLDFTFGYENGLANAKRAKKPAFIFVTTTDCSYCRKLAASFTDPKVAERLDRFELVLVDADKEKDVCKTLGATGYPDIILKHQDRRTFARSPGYVPSDQFIQFLDDSLKKYESL